MYPKVKVKAQREEADQYSYEKNSLESLKAFEWLTLDNSSSSDESPRSVVRVPSVYAPSTPPPPTYLGSRDEANNKKTKKNEFEEEKQKNAKHNNSAPRPRAVLSSPVNDSCHKRHTHCSVFPKSSPSGEILTSPPPAMRVRREETGEPGSEIRAKVGPARAESSARAGKKMIPSSAKRLNGCGKLHGEN